jgi:MOSC domain-containing protein YiiM
VSEAPVARVVSVNLARQRDNPFKTGLRTGIDKVPTTDAVEIRAPGSKAHGAGSGLVGDLVGDRRAHGGDDQAVYAYALEDLQWWSDELQETLRCGQFGENLTTAGVDVNGARVGERWRIGDQVELQVTDPRIPCGTFRGWMNRPGWLRTFVAAHRPGAYLRVVTPGQVREGDRVVVTHRPEHDVTVDLVFRALTTDRGLLPRLLAAADLTEEVRDLAENGRGIDLG